MGQAACCLIKSGDYDYDEPKRALQTQNNIQVESTNRDDRSSGPRSSLMSLSWSSPHLSSFRSDAFSDHELEDILLEEEDEEEGLLYMSPEPDPRSSPHPHPHPHPLAHEVAALITAGDVEALAHYAERRRLALGDVVFPNAVTPLHLAVSRNDFLLVLFLLSRGVGVGARDADGRDAAQWAAQCGHRDMQRLLALHARSQPQPQPQPQPQSQPQALLLPQPPSADAPTPRQRRGESGGEADGGDEEAVGAIIPDPTREVPMAEGLPPLLAAATEAAEAAEAAKAVEVTEAAEAVEVTETVPVPLLAIEPSAAMTA